MVPVQHVLMDMRVLPAAGRVVGDALANADGLIGNVHLAVLDIGEASVASIAMRVVQANVLNLMDHALRAVLGTGGHIVNTNAVKDAPTNVYNQMDPVHPVEMDFGVQDVTGIAVKDVTLKHVTKPTVTVQVVKPVIEAMAACKNVTRDVMKCAIKIVVTAVVETDTTEIHVITDA